MGGLNPRRTATAELYLPSCKIPSLPDGITGRGSVTFLSPTGQIVSCGGLTTTSGCSASGSCGDPSKQCFVLNMDWKSESTDAVGRWESSVVGDLTRDRWRSAVVTLPVGVFVLGGFGGFSPTTSSDFLPAGETTWNRGPSLPIMFVHSCAVKVSSTRFFIISNTDSSHGRGIREFDVDRAAGNPTSSSGWLPKDTWPDLLIRRSGGHGCAIIGNTLVIAGGGSSNKETEILNLETKVIHRGQDMLGPRSSFNLFTIFSPESRPTLLALGGVNNKVEEWDPESETWREADKKLDEARSDYGAVVVDKSLVCGSTITTIISSSSTTTTTTVAAKGDY